MKENIKKSLMIMLKGYKEDVVREEDVLTLIDAIMDNYATNTITCPLHNSNINGVNPPLKYKLTDEYITIDNTKLYRIEALKDFSYVKKGEKGGFVASEKNLSQNGNCWVYRNARVYPNACVFGDAQVYGNASISGKAKVFGNAKVFGDAKVCEATEVYGDAMVLGNTMVYGKAKVFGKAQVFGDAKVKGDAQVYGNAQVDGNAEIGGNAKISSNSDYIIFKNWWSSGRHFTWTRSNNMWTVGCFHGTGEELIAKAYRDSDLSGKEYEKVVKYVETILKDNNTTIKVTYDKCYRHIL